MRYMVDPFLYNVPHLDIHGYDRYGAIAIVRNFIDNHVRIGAKKAAGDAGFHGEDARVLLPSDHQVGADRRGRHHVHGRLGFAE